MPKKDFFGLSPHFTRIWLIFYLTFKEITIKNDDIQRATEDSREQAAVAERRVTLMATEIDELRSGLEQAER